MLQDPTTLAATGPTGRDLGELTIREQKQADKRERIKLAARTLFAEHGFDRTTLRQIAARADVGLGTIMLYADDKRDLVLLMYNDQVTSLIVAGMDRFDENADVISNIINFCEEFYLGFSANVALARTYLQLNFFSEGTNTPGLHFNRGRKIDALRAIIENGQRRGEVRLDVKIDTMATAALLLYRSAVRLWIAEPQPDPAQGLAQLRELMQLQYRGMTSGSEDSGGRQASRKLPQAKQSKSFIVSANAA